MRHLVSILLSLALVAVGCSGSGSETAGTEGEQGGGGPSRPLVPEGPLDPALESNLDAIFSDPTFLSKGDLPGLGDADDIRVAWPLVDLSRFHQGPDTAFRVNEPLAELIGVTPDDDEIAWVVFSDQLLRWDIPAPPDYLEWKRTVFLTVDESWEPFFDPGADVDWREVTWGGVFRDGIEALTDPPTIPATEAGYLEGDEIIFGAEVDGEARAYPRRHMAVHELVNDTLGGREVALPFCTLCGSVIGYFVDDVAATGEPLEMRTSGLLLRSNKLMYDVPTESLFHQFLGRALTGPLGGTGVELNRFPVVTTTWGEWTAEHPDTTVLIEDAGTGRDYSESDIPDRGIETEGDEPVFPVGAVDDRLTPKARVFGVETPEGAAVAFPVDEAMAALRAGEQVEAFGVVVRLEAGGLVASAVNGPELIGHEAFWFAWSQFRPGTQLAEV